MDYYIWRGSSTLLVSGYRALRRPQRVERAKVRHHAFLLYYSEKVHSEINLKNMRYSATREAFKRDIEENLGFRDMDVTDRNDEYKVVIYVLRPAFDRMCERA